MVHLSGGHNASGYGYVYGYVYDYEYSCGFGYEWVATMHPCTIEKTTCQIHRLSAEVRCV